MSDNPYTVEVLNNAPVGATLRCPDGSFNSYRKQTDGNWLEAEVWRLTPHEVYLFMGSVSYYGGFAYEYFEASWPLVSAVDILLEVT